MHRDREVMRRLAPFRFGWPGLILGVRGGTREGSIKGLKKEKGGRGKKKGLIG